MVCLIYASGFFFSCFFLQTEGQSGERDTSHRARSHRGSADWSSEEEQHQIAQRAIQASIRETSEPEGGGSMAVAPLEQSWAANAMYETGDSCTVAPLSRAMMLMGAGIVELGVWHPRVSACDLPRMAWHYSSSMYYHGC